MLWLCRSLFTKGPVDDESLAGNKGIGDIVVLRLGPRNKVSVPEAPAHSCLASIFRVPADSGY